MLVVKATDRKDLSVTTSSDYISVESSSANTDYVGYVVVVFYNDNKLVGMQTALATEDELKCQIPDGANKVKAMWIKGFSSLLPLCTNVQENIQ